MLTIQQIKDAAVEVAVRNGASFAILFGSYARGTADDRSDVDLIFVEDTDLPFLRRLDRYFDPLVDKLRTAVEVLIYTPEEFEDMKDRAFVRRALAEGVIVYESGEEAARVT